MKNSMILDYFYGQTGELFSFYRIPKALFQEQRFQSLSTDAKTLYGILLDRMSLSVKNGWLDEQNRVFILFTILDHAHRRIKAPQRIIHALNNRIASFTAAYVSSIRHSIYRKQKTH